MYVFYPFSTQRIVSHFIIKMLIIIILLTGASGTQTVLAAGGTAQFSIVPYFIPHSTVPQRGYFTYNSKPGFLIQDSLHVTNVGTARGSVDLYAVDATTNQTSGVTFVPPTDPRRDVGAWITLSSQKVTLNPGQSQDVSFSLRVPSSVRPGQHYGGIIARDAIDQTSYANSRTIHATIHVQRQEILGVLVNLPGTLVQKLNITGITYNRNSISQHLLIGLANTGTQMIHPSGNLQVSDTKGHLLQNVPLKLAALLPQTTISYPITIAANALNAGTYSASVSLQYEGGHMAKYATHFIVPKTQPVMTPTPPQSAASPILLPKGGTNHAMPRAIAPAVPPNPSLFNALMPWPYVGGLLVLLALLVALFVWKRRSFIPHRRIIEGRNEQKR